MSVLLLCSWNWTHYPLLVSEEQVCLNIRPVSRSAISTVQDWKMVKHLIKDAQYGLLWVQCVTELQLQLNKEDVYIWNHIVQEVLAMNRFYHSQSHREKKASKCVYWHWREKRGVWNQIHLAWFPASWVMSLTGLDKDGSSPFMSSQAQVVWSWPSPRIK